MAGDGRSLDEATVYSRWMKDAEVEVFTIFNIFHLITTDASRYLQTSILSYNYAIKWTKHTVLYVTHRRLEQWRSYPLDMQCSGFDTTNFRNLPQFSMLDLAQLLSTR